MRTYDVKAYDLIIGDHLVCGFGEGASIEISADSDLFSDVVGIDGKVTRTRSHDRRATLTLTLMASSDSNEVLSDIFKADRDGVNGEGVFPVSLVNREGGDLFVADEAYIARAPDLSLDATVGERVWTIRLSNLDQCHAGLPDSLG